MKEGLRRLRGNNDFTQLREHLEAELAYIKDQLVGEVDEGAFRQLQGRARQLQDTLKTIQTEE